ncbi:MAG: DUF1501 domain-containing protein [Planctomycetia bacterium]|nr:DUF1501 domain-containing protein [Planctomycetia bacterium]
MRPDLSRRELLRIGGVSVLGSLLPRQAALAEQTAAPRAEHCIFMLLQGGPSHLDLWDPKPDAPVEVRGPFQSISTNVAGIQFTEMVPRAARIAEHLLVVRSMEHRFTNHIAGTYVTLTGSNDQPDQDREAKGDDFPGPGAVLNYLQREPSPVPLSVSLPTWLSIPGPSNRMPGQYSGFLGPVHDPFLIAGEPQKKEFRPLSLTLPEGFAAERMSARWSLLGQMDDAARRLERSQLTTHDRLRQSAYELIIDPRVREAVDLSLEPEATRERYGHTKIGQSLLLARRLIEAGVKLVAYNAFNQEWDTHGGLKGRYEDLMPRTDQAFAALISDLADRGMLEKTLVVNTGEFGRTPIINKDAGRDHWPNAYTTVLAGGGLQGGQVYGASDKKGAFVADLPVHPCDVLATLYHQLGIPSDLELHDTFSRPHTLSRGKVMREWLRA